LQNNTHRKQSYYPSLHDSYSQTEAGRQDALFITGELALIGWQGSGGADRNEKCSTA